MKNSRKISRRRLLQNTGQLSLASLAAPYLGLSASGAYAKDGQKMKLIQQVPSLQNTYFANVTDGASAAAKALGIDYQHLLFDGSSGKELSQMQQASSIGADAVFTFAQQEASSPHLIETATNDGLYVTNIFSNRAWSTPLEPRYNGHYAGFFAPDNVTCSQLVAESLFQKMGSEGRIIHITGVPGETTTLERNLGLKRALAKYEGIEVVATQSGYENRVKTRPVIENLLTAHPNIDGVVCHNDDESIAVLHALEARGMDNVKVGGNDALDEFLDAMQTGPNAVSTVAIHGGWFGGYNVVRNFDAVNGVKFSPLEHMMFQDSLVIDTPDAAKDYQKVMYAPDSLPFDWRLMSKHLNPDNWDPQVALAPIDPTDYWPRIGYDQPSDYSLPGPLKKALSDDALEKITARYKPQADNDPLSEIVKETETQKTVLGR